MARGFRYNEGKKAVGSLLLGLHDEAGLLNHVGFTVTIKASAKLALTKKLETLIAPPGFTSGHFRHSTEPLRGRPDGAPTFRL